jgi:hypothetical protein
MRASDKSILVRIRARIIVYLAVDYKLNIKLSIVNLELIYSYVY